MSDLIERWAVIELLSDRRCNTNCFDESEQKIYEELSKAIEDVNAMPSAQSEIIRCKDCKYWDTSWQNDYAPNYHYCPNVDGTRRDDFYCADAERRTDD